MADVSYDVEARLKLSGGGAFKSEMGAAAKATTALQTTVGGLAKMSGGLGDLAWGAAKFAGAAALAGVTVGTAFGGKIAGAVGANLSMLEDKSIQLASVIGAAAEVPFDKARRASGRLFEDFRKDAITSAGETADFVNVASMIAGPIFGAGKSMRDLRAVTKDIMSTAPAFGVSFEQAGSDIMRMLQGVTGVEQPLFRAMVAIPSLGIKKAEEFNKWSPEKRYQKVVQALSNPAFRAAADAAGQSMTGLLSTTEDVLKTVGGLIGGPIYGLFKKGLSGFTGGAIKLLDSDAFKGKLDAVGGQAEIAFRRIGYQLGRIFPDFNTGANSAVDLLGDLAISGLGKLVDGSKWIADHWGEIKAFAKETATFITDAAAKAESFVKAMGGGDFATGAKRIAEAMVAQKAASAVAPVLSGGLAVGQGLWGLGKIGAGLLGGGGAAAGATAAGGATGAGAAAGAAGTAAGIGAAGVATAAGAVVLAFGAVALAAGNAARLWRETDGFKNEGQRNAESIKERINERAGVGDVASVQKLGVQYDKAVRDSFGGLFGASSIGEMKSAVAGVTAYIDSAAQTADANRQRLDSAAKAESDAMAVAGDVNTPISQLVDMYNNAQDTGNAAMATMAGNTILASGKTAEDLASAGMTLAGGIAALSAAVGAAAASAGATTSDPGTIAGKLTAFQVKSGADIMGKGKGAAPKGGGGGGQTVTIKWDLGDGNEEAIYVRSRRDIIDMTKAAKGSIRGGRMPGAFG